MTGTRHGAIDFDWLISNLEISDVPYGVEKKKLGALKTFVLGPKAIYAAETYVLALFQLYPAVYFHKATRGAEKIFAQLLLRVVTLVREGSVGQTGLSTKHPLIAFVRDTENVERILDLDDTVIWGALTMMAGAKDKDISHFARCLRDRRLYKCVDVRERLAGELRDKGRLDDLRLDKGCAKIQRRIESWIDEKGIAPSKILIDQGKREPYKRFQEDKGPLNQIMVKSSDGRLHDLVNFSPAVKAIKAFKFFRVYVPRDNREVLDFIEKEIRSQGRK
jgi:HD superfamily phosphohydrolase